MYQTQDGDVTLIMDDERVEDKIWRRSLFETELKQFQSNKQDRTECWETSEAETRLVDSASLIIQRTVVLSSDMSMNEWIKLCVNKGEAENQSDAPGERLPPPPSPPLSALIYLPQ